MAQNSSTTTRAPDDSDAGAAATPQPAAANASADGGDDQLASATSADATAAADAAAEDAAPSEDELATLREARAALAAELEAARDQALRAQADADNTRRRAAREVENARKFAVERLAADLLPAIDSFEHALEAAAAAAETTAAEGIELSLKLLCGALEKAGVQVIEPLGEPFDPRFHEAMGMMENPDAAPGSVTAVVQKGYVLNERVVRAAMVMVAKAVPQTAAPTAQADAEGDSAQRD